jgi:hypothetical protein
VDKLQSLKLGFRPVLGCDFIRLALNREHAVILEHHKQKNTGKTPALPKLS